jgi:acetyl-CoA carboxylase carboxyl transferase beta subunit/acetyl-CoA carboxylase carboxyl transferase alpha subunit
MTEPLSRTSADDVHWTRCAACGEMIYLKRLERNQRVCPECGHHGRLTALERIAQLFDADDCSVLDWPVHSVDVLGFTDTKPYPARLAAARAATGLSEGVVVAEGTIGGRRLIAAVMDFNFLGGSLGSATGELITQAAERALQTRVPLLVVSASGGARMQEGAIALMQMAKTAQALGRLDEAGILTISLITDPTYGGVAASFSTLCDVIVAEPGARLGFAGPRVIQQTIRQTLPAGFQTAEFLLEHGLIDTIVPRSLLRGTITRLLATGGGPQAPRPRVVRDKRAPDAVRNPEELVDLDPWTAVQQARDLSRPTIVDYLSRSFQDFEELHGDRIGSECPAITGGLARLDDIPVMVIGHHKGHTVAELTDHNFGMPGPGGYRKAARLIRLAAKLGLPVVTFVDTPGAYPGISAEEHGQAMAIAENIRLLAGVPVPVVTLITGEGGSGGALALAVADEVMICSRGVYSVISPEGCAAILWNAPEKAATAAAALRLDAKQLLELGVVDAVLPEPEGGNGSDHAAAAEQVREVLAQSLRRLAGLDPQTLVARRRARFRSFGTAAVTRNSGQDAS